jgi:hypothetical protein
MDGQDSRAIPFERLSGMAGGLRRGIGRAASDAGGEAASEDGGSAGGHPAATLGATGIESFTNRTRLGCGSRIRRTLGAVMLLAGVMWPAVGWGQAMGRLSLEGPSPLPLAPRIAEPVAAATQKTPGNAGSNAAAPAAVARTVNAVEPDAIAVARSPAPLPDIKPPEMPKPASNPAVSATDAAPAMVPAAAPAASTAAASAGGSVAGGANEAKPVNDVEKRAIRSGAGSGVADEKAAPGDGAKGGVTAGLGGVGQVIAALAIVVGLIFIGRALVRKFVPGAAASNGKGVIEILARHPLAKNQAIVLVRIGSQIVALNQGKESSESVLVISEPMEVSRIIGQIEGKSPASLQAGFNRLLANARMDLENGEAEPAPLGEENLDEQLEEMAAAKRQLMELRQHVRTVRDSLPRE